jgi:hypothetical protein
MNAFERSSGAKDAVHFFLFKLIWQLIIKAANPSAFHMCFMDQKSGFFNRFDGCFQVAVIQSQIKKCFLCRAIAIFFFGLIFRKSKIV